MKRSLSLPTEDITIGDDNMEIIEIKVDSELLEQLEEVITPMGLTLEMLIQMFFEWCVNPETKDEAIAWLQKRKEELI